MLPPTWPFFRALFQEVPWIVNPTQLYGVLYTKRCEIEQAQETDIYKELPNKKSIITHITK